MRLPRLPYEMPRTGREIVALRGVNLSDSFADGDLAACENLSTRRYPYFAVRRGRKKLAGYAGVTAMTAWEKLVTVQGNQLFYDGSPVGTVLPGEKQFAVVNTRLIIWPDKKYLDLQALSVKDLGASAAGTGAVFTETALTLSGAPALTGLFAAGDTVSISGCESVPANNKDVRILSLTDTAITVAKGSFQAGTERAAVTVSRNIPDLDYICESGNRLWGCSNANRTIYASSLGDPTNFYSFNGLSTDSYTLAVGSEGVFTGCCKLSSTVLFWKERTLHKILGSYPAEYSMYTYNIDGLQNGSYKSMQVSNDTLYYQGVGGVYAYAGGTPQRISESLGEMALRGGVAGTDGERYYLSALAGEARHLLVYDLRRGIWLREDDTRCRDFARLDAGLCLLDDQGEIYQCDGGEEDREIEWFAQFTPFYETIQGRKRCSRLTLRLELPAGAWVEALLRCDGGLWARCGRWVGREFDAVTVALPIRRCDKFELRLRGKGPCAVLSILREYAVGSAR